MKKLNWKKAIIIAIYFGGFQALMPVIGYFLGTTFEDFVSHVDHWIAFILLGFIGGNMIKESFDDELEKCNDNVDFKTMIVLAIATSIDALAVGITFAILPDTPATITAVTIATGPVGPDINGKLQPKIPAINERIIAPQIPAEAPMPEATPNANACGNAIILAIIAPNISPFKVVNLLLIFKITSLTLLPYY